MTVRTRQLRSSDEEQWRALWTGYLSFYDSAVSEEVYQATFNRLINPDRPEQICIVAEDAGRLIGLAHVVYHAHNWRIENVCYLQDLYVVPRVRGTGAGRALIEAVYAAADASGAPSVYWLTQDFNVQARQLYDRVGKVTPFVKYNR